VVAAGVIELTRGPGTEVERYSKYDSIVLPAGTVHQITAIEAPVKVVIIHPDRKW
jgi:quercetin dioxygenase-like cupin family protein